MTLESIGRIAVRACLDEDEVKNGVAEARRQGYAVVEGRVGSMELGKVVAAIETAAKRESLTTGRYREEHALYHAVLEGLCGVCRGNLALGSILRTVGLRFVVVRGPKGASDEKEGEWIAVALYGSIGAPVRGWEHEAIGLGINHI
jgi:hut operon positive regulator